MEPNIFSLVSKKIIQTVIAIGSLFYSTIPGVNAEFENLELGIKGDQVVISCRLTNCFTAELEQLFRSGREIRIYFLVETKLNPGNTPVYDSTFYHALRYSPMDGDFKIFLSESQENYTGVDLRRAQELLVTVTQFAAVQASQLAFGKEYFIQVSAWMEKIRIQGREDPLNLMFYWNSLKPVIQSPGFTRDIFRQ